MRALDQWSRLINAKISERPMSFVTGMRNIVRKNSRCDSHSHPHIEIIYHPSGHGTTCLGDNLQHEFAEGSVIVHAPNERHDQTMRENGEDLCVHVGMPAGKGLVPPHGFYIPVLRDPLIIEELRALSRGHAQLDRAEKIIYDLRATAALLALIRLAFHEQKSETGTIAERHVFRAEQYIRENYSQIVSPAQVAKAVGIGADHLRHLFKSVRGKNMIHYLTETRLDRAKALLIHSQLSVKEIATMCGFKDGYYFSSVFQKHASISPTQFRLDHGSCRGLRASTFRRDRMPA